MDCAWLLVPHDVNTVRPASWRHCWIPTKFSVCVMQRFSTVPPRERSWACVYGFSTVPPSKQNWACVKQGFSTFLWDWGSFLCCFHYSRPLWHRVSSQIRLSFDRSPAVEFHHFQQLVVTVYSLMLFLFHLFILWFNLRLRTEQACMLYPRVTRSLFLSPPLSVD